MPKNIIVTGGSGVAGKWVVKDLLDQGHQVLNLGCATRRHAPCSPI